MKNESLFKKELKKENKGGCDILISVFHPNLLFCNLSDWDDEIFQDSFISELLSHLDNIDFLGFRFGWSSELSCAFWEEAPWRGDSYYENLLLDVLYQQIVELEYFFESPPDGECQVKSDINLQLADTVHASWLTLIHRILHSQCNTLIPVKFGSSNNESITCSCDCSSKCYSNEYLLVSNPDDWYTKVDFMDLCPSSVDNWYSKIKVAISLCHKQEFFSNEFKISIDNIKFKNKFISDFLDLNDAIYKRTIIRKLTKVLTLNHSEAALDGGLQEELIRGVYRLRISGGRRMHYVEELGIKTFISFNSTSGHDRLH